MHNDETDPLSNEGIERELRDALAVDHSPEFVARVRGRIANRPMGSRAPKFAWTVVWAAVLVAAGFAVGWRSHTKPPDSVPQVASSHATGPAAIEPIRLEAGGSRSGSALVLTTAQVPSQQSPSGDRSDLGGRMISGPDIGFRVEATDRGKAFGRVMVRVNGEWLEARFSTSMGVVPVGDK